MIKLIDTLRAQAHDVSAEDYQLQIEEEEKKLTKEIKRAFANKTYKFEWKGGMNPTTYRALQAANCVFYPNMGSGHNFEFTGWTIHLMEPYNNRL